MLRADLGGDLAQQALLRRRQHEVVPGRLGSMRLRQRVERGPGAAAGKQSQSRSRRALAGSSALARRAGGDLPDRRDIEVELAGESRGMARRRRRPAPRPGRRAARPASAWRHRAATRVAAKLGPRLARVEKHQAAARASKR